MKFDEAFKEFERSGRFSPHSLHDSHYIKIKILPRLSEAGNNFVQITTNGHVGVQYHSNQKKEFKEAIVYIQNQLLDEIEALCEFSQISFEDLVNNHLASKIVNG
jgi:hypothetical protein